MHFTIRHKEKLILTKMSSLTNLGILPRQLDQSIFLFLQRQLQYIYNRSNFGPLALGSELRALGLVSTHLP